MSNYDPNFTGDRLDRRDKSIEKSNSGWLMALAVIFVIAVAGAFAYNHHHSGNDVASTNNPVTANGQPTTGRSISQAPQPGIDTTAPTAPAPAQ